MNAGILYALQAQTLPLVQALKQRGKYFAAALHHRSDAPDFSRFAAWVAVYPDRQ